MGVQKHKQPPEGWGEEEWRRYQEGLAAKKAAEEALGKSDVPAEATDERPAAEIAGEIMSGMPKYREESAGHRGPWIEVRRREEEPNPLVEWLRRLFRRKPEG
jgi:hypothetical protein